MRAVVQRVTNADVKIDGRVNGKIDDGLLVLLGVGNGDTEEDMKYIADKIIKLRIFSDENDIVCAAVSAVTHLVLNGIENVVGVSFGYETEDGYLYFVLPEDVSLADREKLNVLLDSMFLFLINLEKQYSDNITIIESEV